MKTLAISPNDYVAIIFEGEKKGHKLALTDIPKGDKVSDLLPPTI